MKRKKTTIFFLLVLLLTIHAPLTAFATSYMPFFHRQDKRETDLEAGHVIYLFHSGTDDVRKSIRENDILAVYRISRSCKMMEVGKIKVIAYIGDTHIKGEVVEGKIKPDDIARKESTSCLVISAGICNP